MKKEKKYLKPLLAVLAIFTFIGIILAIRFGNNPKAKIVKQPSSTIVIIQSDTDQIYVGYVKDELVSLYPPDKTLN